jgi:hypothetical protein
MAKDFWEKWEYRTWLADTKLTDCDESTRGIWADWVSHMMEGQTYFIQGTLDDLATKGRTSKVKALAAIKDLFFTNAANVEFQNVTQNVTHFVTGLSRTYNGKITVINRKRERKLKTKLNNALRQQRHRDKQKSNADVTPQSQSKSNSNTKSVTKRSTTKRAAITPAEDPFNPRDASKLGYAVAQLFQTFPHLRIPSSKALAVAREFQDTSSSRKAWDQTMIRYLGNHDPTTGYYAPEKIGTVISVYREELERVEKNQNGTSKQNGQPNRRTSVDRLRDQAELIDSYPSEEELAGVPRKT